MEKVTNVPTAAEDDFPSLVNFAKEHGIGLVVAGPDDAVVNGIAGHFEDAAIPCFAPSKKAAEVEGSKAYSKAFMKKYGIPTASYKAFDNYDDAKAYLESVNCSQIVLKVDGLAAGKGVVLPSNEAEAHEALRSMMVDSKFGSSGQSVVIEELLDGDEISILTFADGTAAFKSLPPGQDHNRIFEGNKGPNTGGMGVYAPLAFVTPDDLRIIDQDIIKPTLDGLRAEGRLFAGMLFTGVMMTSKGPKVLEYNARFGDPETQTMMMLLAPECDLAAVLMACSTKKLQTVADKISVRPGFACNVVVAAGGYPESYRKGDGISLGECPLGIEIFHAGTERTANGELVTSGGRVLSVAAHGATLEQAVSLAYEGVKHIQFKDKTYRKDIAAR
uniref:phosphoribosylamine--glycine ligase n=1 Tax=Bionectria ochroleuca TaxID=29856 RepID=A0A0B7JTN8_BIOOC